MAMLQGIAGALAILGMAFGLAVLLVANAIVELVQEYRAKRQPTTKHRRP